MPGVPEPFQGGRGDQGKIRKLHEKIDHLLMHQWQRLMDIQQLQVNLMGEISQLSMKQKQAEWRQVNGEWALGLGA